MKVTYDGEGEGSLCPIGLDYNAGKNCTISFTPTKKMDPPILVHYEITNFHQNHRNYYRSRDDFQLRGKVGDQDSISEERCDPLNELGGIKINPCGMIANTFFNDIIQLTGGVDTSDRDLQMIETGIAWRSDIEYLFDQPEGFEFEPCPGACDASCCTGIWECGELGEPYEDPAGNCFRFVYPEDNTTQYLYETYPDIINPIEGVLNEHFIVWMRVAAQPTFRKLYGWINQEIAAGETVTFEVNSNFVVDRFRGTKSLVMSTNNIFGGRNPYLGPIFFYVGLVCLGFGTLFALKHKFRPRKLADPSYLHFKTD